MLINRIFMSMPVTAMPFVFASFDKNSTQKCLIISCFGVVSLCLMNTNPCDT